MLQKLNEIVYEVQKEEWYKVSNGSVATSVMHKGQRKSRRTQTVHVAEITLQYREVSFLIKVAANDMTRGFEIRSNRTSTTRRTKSAAKAVVMVSEALAESVRRTDEQIEKQYRIEEEQERERQQRENISTSFKRPLIKDEYNTTTLTFKMSKNYELEFNYLGKPGEETFYVDRITGTFSSAQIEKFIECLAECPEAAADRLIHGK